MNFPKRLSLAAPTAVLIVLGTASLAPTLADTDTVNLTIPSSPEIPGGASVNANPSIVGVGQGPEGTQSVTFDPLYPTTLDGQTGTTLVQFIPDPALTTPVPEPSAVYGIAAFGVMGAVFSFKRQRQLKRG